MISVCMTTYNGEKYLKEQIESILMQLGTNDELIISDDSSFDGTQEIIRGFNDSRIIYLNNNRFKSPIYNIEYALSKANGEYIYIADQDDIWLPNKVEVTQVYLKYNLAVVSDCMIIDKLGNIIKESFFKFHRTKSGFLFNFYRNSYLGCCMAFKRILLEYVLPFPKDLPMHDIWLGLIAEIHGGVFFLPIPLVKYRRHESNVSTTSGLSENSCFKKILIRIRLLMLILKHLLRLSI